MSPTVPASANTTSAVIARLRAWAAANGWTKSRFAIVAGLRDTTLRGFHQVDWNPTVEILEKLEAVVPVEWQAGDPLPEAAVPNGGQDASARASADRPIARVAL